VAAAAGGSNCRWQQLHVGSQELKKAATALDSSCKVPQPRLQVPPTASGSSCRWVGHGYE
jgi:hypothetical protein